MLVRRYLAEFMEISPGIGGVFVRARDMGAMLAQLRGAGIEIGEEMTTDGIGRFVRIHDPEGNPIELRQPQKGA